MYYGTALGANATFDPARSTISWWCWDDPDFKECHAEKWEQARDYCQSIDSAGYTSLDVCINKETDLRAKLHCGCADSPPAGAAGTKIGTYLLGFSLLALVGVAIYRRRSG